MIIGVTGAIGAGKSTLAAMLRDAVEERGEKATIFDADRAARDVLVDELPRIMEAFGSDVVRKDGTPDRETIAARAFADEESARRLNAIIHPGVVERAREDLSELREKHAAVILDVPLLFESGMDVLCDTVVAVVAEDGIRRDRAKKFGDVVARERRQWSAAAKAAKADHVVTNNGTLEELRARAGELAEKLFSGRKRI